MTNDSSGPFWQRHDLLVLIGGLAFLATGRLAHQSLIRPALIEFEHLGLSLDRPRAWLPPAQVAPETVALSWHLDRRNSLAKSRNVELPYHVVYASPANLSLGLEICITPRRKSRNLAIGLAFDRRIRYGDLYRPLGSDTVKIGPVTWLRTRFRYAHRARIGAEPRVDTGIEYAIAGPARRYAVTFRGSAQGAHRLAALIAPTLSFVPSRESGQSDRPELSLPAGTAGHAGEHDNAAKTTVAVLAASAGQGRLELISSGSGVIVSPDGSVLTSFHVLHDEHTDRLHDLFIIGRFLAPGQVPELVCAGRPERSRLDRDLDLALIKCEMNMSGGAFAAASWPTISLERSRVLTLGERIRVLGYPDHSGGVLSSSAGEITGWTGHDGAPGRIYARTNAAVGPGVSGGPVIDDQGNLTGIIAAFRFRASVSPSNSTVDSLDRVGLVRPIDSAEELLTLARAGWSPFEQPDVLAKNLKRSSDGADAHSSDADGQAADAQTTSAQKGNHQTANGPPSESSSTKQLGVIVLSRVVDAANDRPIAGAVVIVFDPSISTDWFDLNDLEEQALTWGRSDASGEFILSKPLPRGAAYSVAVLAEGYHPLTGEGALVLQTDAPDLFDPWGIIRLAIE